MNQIQAVIFDRDNVLTYFDMQKAMAYFEPLLPISLEQLAQYWWQWHDSTIAPATLSEENLLFESFWKRLGQELDLSVSQMAQLSQFVYTSILSVFNDVLPALQFVKSHGLRVGVLSNFELASIDASLDATGLFPWIDKAMAAPVIGVSKPNPEAYLIVAQALDVPPEFCLYFDDELPCVEGASSVGMQAYWVDRERNQHNLEENIVCDLSAVRILLTP